MHNYSINALEIGLENSTFVEAYLKEGKIYSELNFESTLNIVEINLLLSEFCNRNIVYFLPGVYELDSDLAVKLKVDDLGDHRYIKMAMIGSPYKISVLSNKLAITKYTAPRTPGVYDISIDHRYLNKTGNINSIEHYKDTTDFEYLKEFMYPKIDINDMMKQYSDSDESIVILSGKPGTGKTCFIKMMLAAHAKNLGQDIFVTYVKDSNVLKKDEFWAAMTYSQPHILVLDDLDNELLPRGPEGNPIVSNMLSFSDGVFDVRTKIIITTNLTDSRIDKALVRPGRSFDTLCLPQLDRDEAENIWVKELEAPIEEFERRFGDMKVIMQASIMSEHSRYLKSDSPTYLKDPSISIRKLVEEGEVIES